MTQSDPSGASEPTDEEIALAAYRLWLKEGCPHGRDREHWLQAREELKRARTPEPSPGQPPGPR